MRRRNHHSNPIKRRSDDSGFKAKLFVLIAHIGIVVGALTAFVALLRSLIGLERELEERQDRKRGRGPR